MTGFGSPNPVIHPKTLAKSAWYHGDSYWLGQLRQGLHKPIISRDLLLAFKPCLQPQIIPSTRSGGTRSLDWSDPDSSPSRAIPFPRVVQVTIRPSLAPAEKDHSIASLVIGELSHGSWSRAGG
jgi:hypothetical protein